MKNLIFLPLAIALLISGYGILQAQENSLYMTKEIKRAYQLKTRSFDGNPGENYFQNQTDYKIDVEFDPYTRLLSGSELITYTNNSPDTLIRIVIRLNANILKKGVSRNVVIDPSDVTDGVQLSKLKVGGFEFDLENKPPYLDQNNLYVRLPEPLPPATQLEIEVDWNYIFQANTNIREGRYHETTYFIAYWYPKIAVYDDVYGWNRHIYNGEQEFYQEYGNFDVKVTVPADYYVWSSGVLQNEKEVLNTEKLALFNKAKTSDEVIHILEEVDMDKGDLLPTSKKKTWQFKAGNIPDFAFVVSDTYLWDATSVKVDDKRVLVNTVYYRGSIDFFEVAEISRQTIRLLSERIVGIGYPYPQMTAFNGHFGMEFPMMVNDGDGETRNETLFVTSHEISHTYLPFYVGINEERNAWLDEGFATYLPKEIEDSLSFDEGYNSFLSNISGYSNYAGSKYDMPLMVPSNQLTGFEYRFATYSRSAVAFYVLKDILGNEVFQESLITFINRWAGKHPTAYDFFYTFEDISSQDLTWFWQPWFFEFGYPDLTVKNVRSESNGYSVEIESLGSLPAPLSLIVTFEDSTKTTVTESARLWSTGAKTVSVFISTKKKLKKVEINSKLVPDNNSINNVFVVND